MALAYFSLLSLWALTKYYKNQTLQNLIIFSIYAGTTVVVKYNGAIFIALLYMTLFALMLKEKKIKYYFLSVLISLTMFLPWAYKAYLYTGDPFYPFLINLFHIWLFRKFRTVIPESFGHPDRPCSSRASLSRCVRKHHSVFDLSHGFSFQV